MRESERGRWKPRHLLSLQAEGTTSASTCLRVEESRVDMVSRRDEGYEKVAGKAIFGTKERLEQSLIPDVDG